MDFHQWFGEGMDRTLPPIFERPEGFVLNLGAGNKHISGTVPLDYPDWDAEVDLIPYGDGTVDGIIAYHFLEHVRNLFPLLSECQRVLKSGGVMQIVVPYGASDLAMQDMDHKRFFTEESWRTLFNNPYYNKNGRWEFEVGFNLIAGVVHRNLILMTQLLKVGDPDGF